MTSNKLSTTKGTRDFGPEQSAKRSYIIDKIKDIFKRYGFQELNTPAMENLSILTGKYGDEGDQLIFKILNSGDFLAKITDDSKSDSRKMLPQISEKGLKYDLTVPFARYVVENRHEIVFPFKRFQIQPVWRADKPQKGRYREFYQCDADIIGSKSIWNETELILLIHDVFESLGLTDFSVKVNHRSLLSAFAKHCGLEGKEILFCVELDKLEKITKEKVLKNLIGLGGEASRIQEFLDFISKSQTVSERLKSLKSLLGFNNERLEIFFEFLDNSERNIKVDFDLSLARGLSYYTGMIFEVKPTSVKMGSICGGGRYDNLTGILGLSGVSGVGISFGLDRIYDVMEDLKLFPDELNESIEILIIHFDELCFKEGIKILGTLRIAGIESDLYPESVKIKKQFNYANKIKARNVLIIGQEEMESGNYKLKNMDSGKQKTLEIKEIISLFASR